MRFFKRGVKTKWTREDTYRVVLAAFLIAMAVAVRGLNIYITDTMRISFAFLPIAVAGLLLGPVGGASVGVLSDLLGFLFIPGVFSPGFTLSALLEGLISGLVLYRKPVSLLRVTFARIPVFCINVFLNTWWLSLMYHTPYLVLLGSRVIKEVIMLGVGVALLYAVAKALRRAGRHLGFAHIDTAV